MKKLWTSFMLIILLGSCGPTEVIEPDPPPLYEPEMQEWVEIVFPIVKRSCVRCHQQDQNDLFITDPRKFKYSSKVLREVYNGFMPQPGSKEDLQFSARDRRDLLWYLKGGY